MKTHKVIDVISLNAHALFYGTREECSQWKAGQGFGYKTVPLDPEERRLANEFETPDPQSSPVRSDEAERQEMIDSIYRILGKYGEDREDIKSDFRKLCERYKNL